MKKVLLVGNPNTGKTTLLNALTKSQEHTGNWHGVTVEEKEKIVGFGGREICFVDLPGLYSLNPLSFEEKVSVDYIFKKKYDIIFNICDINFLQKNLYLTLELLLSGHTNIILLVNTMGESVSPEIKNLCFCGIKPLFIDFSNKTQTKQLLDVVCFYEKQNQKIDFFETIFSKKTCGAIEKISKETKLTKYEILKYFEKNNYFFNKINKNNLNFSIFKKNTFLQKENLIQEKYKFIDKNLKHYTKNSFSKTGLLDKIVLNKFLAVPIFLAVMLLIFYLTFFSVGAWLSDGLSYVVQGVVGQNVVVFLKSFCDAPWVIGLVEDGIVGGALGLVSFLPQVVMLFLCLAILEETGYFARISFVFEDIFKSVGLGGKSVYTLLMSFGCSASAILTARAVDDKNLKIKTAILAPYMSCSAKLPIYAVLGGAFFGASNVFVIMLLYLIGIFTALFISVVLDKFLKSQKSHFLMEFPPYKFPALKKICVVALLNMKVFLVKVTTIFVSMSIIIWCLGSFDFSLNYVAQNGGQSILQSLGKIFSPIFAPLGFDNWGAVGALIAGIVAKEIVVSSIAIFNGISENGHLNLKDSLKNPDSAVWFTESSMASYLCFCLLYTPCIASIATLKKEIGLKWTLISIFVQFVSAYVMSFIVFNIYKLSLSLGFFEAVICVFGVFLVLISFVRFFEMFCKKNKCKLCGKCKY